MGRGGSHHQALVVAGIQHQQQSQQHHQQQLNGAVGCPAGKAEQLSAQWLQLVEGGQLGNPAFQALEHGHTTQQLAHAVEQGRYQLGELLHLLDQFGQQQFSELPAAQEQQNHHHHKRLGPVHRREAPQPAHRHIQRHRQHDGTEQNQQHPAQFPGQ
ncbi:MAG: hypothetical protein RLZZ515_85 [Cyanobacteriota bacterium]